MKNLCLAGGVALNCVANGNVQRDGRFDEIWIQPAAGDAGGALGAALAACHHQKDMPRAHVNGRDGMRGAYLGPAFAQSDIEQQLTAAGAKFTVLDEDDLLAATAQALADGKAVGWFQGRMEFGPRALGARSILGDPRSPAMQKMLNLKVKYRESFRPFAPSVLREDVADWFELDARFALHAAGRAGEEEPAARHVGGRARAVRHRQAQRAALGYSGGDACGLFGAHPDGARRHQPALSRADFPLQGADRLPGSRQHQLQRARRADRLHAGGRLPLFHGHRDRDAGRRRLSAAQGRSARALKRDYKDAFEPD